MRDTFSIGAQSIILRQNTRRILWFEKQKMIGYLQEVQKQIIGVEMQCLCCNIDRTEHFRLLGEGMCPTRDDGRCATCAQVMTILE